VYNERVSALTFCWKRRVVVAGDRNIVVVVAVVDSPRSVLTVDDAVL